MLLGKRKDCNPAYADMASHMRTLACVPSWRGIVGGKRKLVEGEVGTIELYYKYRLLLEGSRNYVLRAQELA